MIKIISEMLSYTFLVRGIFVGISVSLCAALLGSGLVLKRYSMIGDGLSHVSFGAMAVATAFNKSPLYIAIPIVVLFSIILLSISDNSNIKGDAALGLISTSSMAVGITTMSITTGMNTDVCNYMFGSILAMRKTDVYLSVFLSIIIILLYILFYNRLFAVTFDEDFARASGIKVKLYKLLIATLTGITIVLGMRMMGALLISSLIIFPALSAMRVTGTYKNVIVISVIVSILCFLIGLILSYQYNLPTGSSIVLVNVAFFIVFSSFGHIKRLSR